MAGLTILRAVSVWYSPCQTWRYLLERDLGEGHGTLNFVMLNPSTADAVRNDPTVTRCIGFARRWGYRRLLVTNLFALRSPAPRLLHEAADPVGPENDDYIRRAAGESDRIVVAWGHHGTLRNREAEVLALLRGRHIEHLGLTRGGQPRHPLYLPAAAKPLPFRRTWRRTSRRPG